jgi:hypothetical protein
LKERTRVESLRYYNRQSSEWIVPFTHRVPTERSNRPRLLEFQALENLRKDKIIPCENLQRSSKGQETLSWSQSEQSSGEIVFPEYRRDPHLGIVGEESKAEDLKHQNIPSLGRKSLSTRKRENSCRWMQ